MKMVKNFILGAILLFSLAACHSNDDLYGDWAKKETIPAKGRIGAVSFNIGENAYVGLGLDGDNYELKDFWKFDGTAWWPMDEFPGDARYGAVAFSDGQYAYVGLGFAQNQNSGAATNSEWFLDFYKFDPTASTGSQWSQIASFPGKERRYAVGFYVSGNGYVGTGYGRDKEGTFKDYWRYDVTGSMDGHPGVWTSVGGGYGDPRQGAVAWVIGESAYIATGVNGTSDFVTDVIKFTPKSDTPWESLDKLKDFDGQGFDNDYPRIPRAYAVAFKVGNESDKSLRIYLATGSRLNSLLSDCWEFNPYERDGKGWWDEVTGFPTGALRQAAVAFTCGGYGFVTVGGAVANSMSSQITVRQSTYIFYPGIDDEDQNDD